MDIDRGVVEELERAMVDAGPAARLDDALVDRRAICDRARARTPGDYVEVGVVFGQVRAGAVGAVDRELAQGGLESERRGYGQGFPKAEQGLRAAERRAHSARERLEVDRRAAEGDVVEVDGSVDSEERARDAQGAEAVAFGDRVEVDGAGRADGEACVDRDRRAVDLKSVADRVEVAVD